MCLSETAGWDRDGTQSVRGCPLVRLLFTTADGWKYKCLFCLAAFQVWRLRPVHHGECADGDPLEVAEAQAQTESAGEAGRCAPDTQDNNLDIPLRGTWPRNHLTLPATLIALLYILMLSLFVKFQIVSNKISWRLTNIFLCRKITDL